MSITSVDAGYTEVRASADYVSITSHDDSYCGLCFEDKAEFEAFVGGLIDAGCIAFNDFNFGRLPVAG